MKWSEYNESLVRRGEILLGFDVIDNWDKELKEMNRDKPGEPFHYPNTLVLMLGYAKAYFHLPYRQTEGIVKSHAGNRIPSIPDFSTINRRVNRLDLKLENKNKMREDKYITITIDSSGIKKTNRGQWMNEKWNVQKQNRKGYLKIHVAVDIRSKKILSMEITDEHVHDNKMLPKLVDNTSIDGFVVVDRVLGDGAYDSNATFKYLSEKGIMPCIKVRKNSRVRWKTANLFRNLSVIAQRRNNFERWKDSVSYGQRWAVETVFSSLKRTFGEYVYSIKMENMKQELMLKASLYNKFISI